MTNSSQIKSSIHVKNFLKDFYKHDFFVEKDKRKNGEKIFIFSKEESLSKKFIDDLYSLKSKVKINGNKVGLLLEEWQQFIDQSSGKKKSSKADSSQAEIFSDQKKDQNEEGHNSAKKNVRIKSEPDIKNESVLDNEIEYWQLSKADFLKNIPAVITVPDWNGKIRTYTYNKKQKAFHIEEDGKVMVSATAESIHEKLICKAYKEGKPVDTERIILEYPYFFVKCKEEHETDDETDPDIKEENLNEEQPVSAQISQPVSSDDLFVADLHKHFEKREKLRKKDLEKIAAVHGINEITRVYELAEYAWIKWYRKISLNGDRFPVLYKNIVEFYKYIQPTFSLRDSVRVEFQQYSTAAPIAYLAQIFCKVNEAELIFEPSAGNGLLVFAAPYSNTIVNELDKERLENLQREPFKQVINQDAELPFPDLKGKVDAVLTNPPFGRLSEKIKVDGYNIKVLDHAMVTVALDTMKDNGRAAIVIGGHTKFTDDGMIRAFRIFFNWLFHYYHVCDIININGDLYAKQGTNFDIRLILLDGRKSKPEGFAPLIKNSDHPLRKVVTSFEQLFDRVNKSLEDPEWLFKKDTPVKVIEETPKEVVKEVKPETKPNRHVPLHEQSLYEYAIGTPTNCYEVKKVSEVNLEKEDWYRLAHKARFMGEEYYTMAWKLHYDAVSKALQEGIKVSYEIIKDYPNLLRQYSERYGIIEDESVIPMTYEEWIGCCVIISKGLKHVTIYSSLKGEVFYSVKRHEWDHRYEQNDEAREQLLQEIHRKYVSKKLTPDISAPPFSGILILIKNQLEIALRS